MKTCVVIYNPKSGHRKMSLKKIERIKSILLDYEYESDFIFTEYAGHATEIVEGLDSVDLVISIGGDGTFNEAVRGNINRKKQLLHAHLPMGTTNDVATMFGYGDNIFHNLELALTGVAKKIDICSVNDVPFTYSACIGKYTDVPYMTPRELKKRMGYLAYLIQIIKRLRIKKVPVYDVDFSCDGKKYSGKYTFIIVSSADRIAGINHIYKDIKLDDDQFEILFCTLKRKIDIVRSVSYLIKGDIAHAPGFEFYRASNFKIDFHNTDHMNWCIDGDKLNLVSTEYEFDNKAKVELLIPRKKIDDLFIEKQKKQ